MNENELNNDNQVDTDESDKISARAAKILAIKKSMLEKNKQLQAAAAANDNITDLPAEEVSHETEHIETANEIIESVQESASDSDWEDEIAQRIAMRVKKVKGKQQGKTLQSNNKELESLIDMIPMEASEIDSSDNSITPNEQNIEHSTFPTSELDEENKSEEAESVAADIDDFSENEQIIPEEAVEKEIISDEVKPKKKKKKKSVKETLLGFLPQKADSILERVRKIVFLGALAAIVVCGYIILDYYVDNAHTQGVYDDLMDDYSYVSTPKSSESSDDYEYWPLLSGAKNLLEINKDVVGVINIPGADIFYPVLQSDDNEEYLEKNINGEKARAGAIFLDYRNDFDRVVDGKLAAENSDNLIIYGHEMANGMMFGNLKNYKDNSSFYGENPIIELNSNYATYQYKIFAFFIVDSKDETDTYFDYWNYIDFADETEFYNYVNEAKRRTFRLNDVDVKYGDPLLTLSTCNGIFGEDAGGRFVVLARLVREGEDPYEGTQNNSANPNIKWPTLYYKYNEKKYDPDAEFIPYG